VVYSYQGVLFGWCSGKGSTHREWYLSSDWYRSGGKSKEERRWALSRWNFAKAVRVV
jgi:hypothetical protein